jgi:hypothetical protein
MAMLFMLAFPTISMADQPDNGDVDCDDVIGILDIVHLINFKYKSGDPPCPFISPGVAYQTIPTRTIDVGFSYSNLITLYFDAPAAGWVNVNFSFYVNTESYCLMYQIYDEILDKSVDERYVQEIFQYSTDSPFSWNIVFEAVEGLNTIRLDVRSCARDQERANINFRSINIAAQYYPENYTVIPRD